MSVLSGIIIFSKPTNIFNSFLLHGRCWRENEDERPSFKEIQTEMLIVMRENGLKNNMMDNMVERMEKYTNHLEEIVTERTGELRTEKQKTGISNTS